MSSDDKMVIFPRRELPPYAESVSSVDLKLDSVYFNLTYVPGEMLLHPVLKTLVFIGRDLDAGDQDRVYFQDVGSHRRGVRYDDGEEASAEDSESRGEIFCGSENELGAFFEYERALDELIKCSLRRQSQDQMIPNSDERELKAFAEPLLPPELQEGAFYFLLSYVDDEMLIPLMDTRAFVGKNLEPGDSGKLYFQDVDSYAEGIRYDPANKETWATFYIMPEDDMLDLFLFESALEELMRCSLRRRSK